MTIRTKINANISLHTSYRIKISIVLFFADKFKSWPFFSSIFFSQFQSKKYSLTHYFFYTDKGLPLHWRKFPFVNPVQPSFRNFKELSPTKIKFDNLAASNMQEWQSQRNRQFGNFSCAFGKFSATKFPEMHPFEVVALLEKKRARFRKLG